MTLQDFIITRNTTTEELIAFLSPEDPATAIGIMEQFHKSSEESLRITLLQGEASLENDTNEK